MADLKVDYDALDALERSLTFVNDEFKSLGSDVNTIDHASGWGSGGFRSGMDSVQHGLADPPGRSSSPRSTRCSRWSTQTTQIFQETDQTLAKEMTDAQADR